MKKQIASDEFGKSSVIPCRGQLEQFYQQREYRLAWFRDGILTSQAGRMVSLLSSADQKGLNPEDYDAPLWPGRMARLNAGGTKEEQVAADVRLTSAVLRYICDLQFGRVDPLSLHFLLGPQDRSVSPAGFLATSVVDSSHPAQALAAIEPPYAGYRRTIVALEDYESLPQTWATQLQPPRRPIFPGQAYPDLPALCDRLVRLGDLGTEVDSCARTNLYAESIASGVEKFQRRHGLPNTGQIDRETVAALNVPARTRIEQLDLTLERWRWVPHNLHGPLIVANIPEFQLHALDADEHWSFSQRIIVGRTYRHKTPVFVGEMRSIIFRPYWNVPESIQVSELVPHLEKDPAWLSKHGYEIVDRRTSHPVENKVSPETLVQLRSGTLRIRQKPGEDNALGLIKFDFPNQFDVYMHGTPSADLFSQSRRDFSHGCIRVENPAALAAWVLAAGQPWTPERIQRAMHGTDSLSVTLAHPIPVVIIYGTAVVEENGEIDFLKDVYGYDAALRAALQRQRRGSAERGTRHVPAETR